MKYLLFGVLLFIEVVACAQKNNKIYQNLSELDRQPEYVGGQVALIQYLSKNIRIPKSAKESGICSRMNIEFIVEKNGKVRFWDCKCIYQAIDCTNVKKTIENMLL